MISATNIQTRKNTLNTEVIAEGLTRDVASGLALRGREGLKGGYGERSSW